MANNGGPWGNGGGNNPWGGGGRPDGPFNNPPDLDALLRRSRQRFQQVMPGQMGPGKVIGLVVLGALALLAVTGLYTVPDGQVGVVQRFGAPIRQEEPGLQWRIPLVERVAIISTSQVFRLQVAANTGSSSKVATSQFSSETKDYRSRLDDVAPTRMVTRDLNLVEVEFAVFWQINDPQKFLFNIRAPEDTLRMAAESVVREVVGRSTIEDVIPIANPQTAVAAIDGADNPAAAAAAAAPVQGSLGRMAIEMRDRLQKLVDGYDAGIKVTDLQLTRAGAPRDVADAFADVQQAQQDASTAINQAQVYANNTRAEAEGQSSRIKAEAIAYKAQVVSAAQGDADRFNKVLEAYSLSKETTATRMYLETMEEVLKGANKMVLDNDTGTTPYLPLPNLRAGTSSTPAN